jgi:dsDNA-specific endonuclease/ATPase MutS2
MQQRGRQCVSVKAGRQGELPKGSVKLGSSKTGATFYMEPAPLIELNNADARLTSQERQAEERVLRRLSASVAASSPQILQVKLQDHRVSAMRCTSLAKSTLGRNSGWQVCADVAKVVFVPSERVFRIVGMATIRNQL